MLGLSDTERVRGVFDLSGKTALVTGGAAGLGRQMAFGMACFGADVVLADIDAERVRATAEEISKATGVRTLPVEVDVRDEGQVTRMVEQAFREFGKIDIAVNNPGINCRKPILELTIEEFEAVQKVNLRGTFLCAREVGRTMVARRMGKIINMSSIFGQVAMPFQAAYASSKGAIIQLTKVLALEWAPYNIQVNALAPAHHKTELAAQLMSEPTVYEELLKRIPQHRFAEAEEIVGPAIFLASRASDFVTGTTIFCDGGWTAQ